MGIFETKWRIPSRTRCGVFGGVVFISMYAFSNFSRNPTEACLPEKSSRLGENGTAQISQNNFSSPCGLASTCSNCPCSRDDLPQGSTSSQNHQFAVACLPRGCNVQFVKQTSNKVFPEKKDCRSISFWCLIEGLRRSTLNMKCGEHSLAHM